MKYRTLPMIATTSKLALLHKLERGKADATDAWHVAEQIINGDPCDNWPYDTVGIIQWSLNNDHRNHYTRTTDQL